MNYLDFDELSKAVSTSTSRRQAIKLFGATTVGGVLSLVGAGGATAAAPGRCRNAGTVCRQNEECCSHFCDPSTARCACAPGTFTCPSTGICVTCSPGQTFNPTTCACECPAGTTACGNQCCVAGQVCAAGACCTNPLTCSGSSDCCSGFRCDIKLGRCVPCTNPPSCKTSSQCCAGFICAQGGICAPVT